MRKYRYFRAVNIAKVKIFGALTKRDVALNARNCADEIVMHNINIEEDGGLLPALQKYMKMIVIPQINKYDKWGSLMENKQGKLFDRPNSFSGPYIFFRFNQGSEHKNRECPSKNFENFGLYFRPMKFSSSQQLSSQLV